MVTHAWLRSQHSNGRCTGICTDIFSSGIRISAQMAHTREEG
jgi:hypothetical protein